MLESLRPVFINPYRTLVRKSMVPFWRKEVREPKYVGVELFRPAEAKDINVFYEERIIINAKAVSWSIDAIGRWLDELKPEDATARLTMELCLEKSFSQLGLGLFVLGRIPAEIPYVFDRTIFVASSAESKRELQLEKALNVVLEPVDHLTYWRMALRFRNPEVRKAIEATISGFEKNIKRQLWDKLDGHFAQKFDFSWTGTPSNLLAHDIPQETIEGLAAAYWLLTKGVPRIKLMESQVPQEGR